MKLKKVLNVKFVKYIYLIIYIYMSFKRHLRRRRRLIIRRLQLMSMHFTSVHAAPPQPRLRCGACHHRLTGAASVQCVASRRAVCAPSATPSRARRARHSTTTRYTKIFIPPFIIHFQKSINPVLFALFVALAISPVCSVRSVRPACAGGGVKTTLPARVSSSANNCVLFRPSVA